MLDTPRITRTVIDFPRVFRTLRNINYRGVLTFESKNLRDAIKSREIASEIISNEVMV